MKKNILSSTLLLLMCALCFVGCDDDEDSIPRFPEGTSSLRMMNEDNGRTMLGNSDVYITRDGNFRSSQSPLFDMGKKKGIGDIEMPDFINMAPEVAATPGHGYVICNAGEVKDFPSGIKAIKESAYVYRAYVDSWIMKENEIQGANVYFLRGKPLEGVLPAWGSNIGSINVYIHNDYADESLTVKFPKFNAKDVEAVCINDYTQEEMLQCSVSSKGIKLQVPHELGYIRENYKVQIRYKHVYTEVDVNIIFKDTKD